MQDVGMVERTDYKPKLAWTLTPWVMSGRGSWKQQPVLLVEGRVPFFADHPSAYIAELERLHDDDTVTRGTFHTFIGQFRDALENVWEAKGAEKAAERAG